MTEFNIRSREKINNNMNNINLTPKKGKESRKEGFIPAIAYNKNNNILLEIEEKSFIKELKPSIFTTLITQEINGKNLNFIVKAVKLFPLKKEGSTTIEHIDLLIIDPINFYKIKVPVKITGEDKSPAIKAGGSILKIKRYIEMTFKGSNILSGEYVKEIEVNVSSLEKGHKIFASDIPLLKGKIKEDYIILSIK